MKKVGLWFFLLLLLSTFAYAEKVRMAIFQLEPFLTLSGERTDHGGITVVYWRDYIAPRMGVELEVLGPFPSKRAELMLEHGEVDTVSQLTKIPEREAAFLYPETHLTEIQSCLVVLPESPILSVSKTEDLFDKRIVFMEKAYIPPLLVHERIVFDLVATEDYRQTFFNMLFAGRVDACLDINYVSLLYSLHNRGYDGKVRIVMLPVEPVKVYSIFNKSEKGMRLMKAFDAINGEGLKTGEFQKLTEELYKSYSIRP